MSSGSESGFPEASPSDASAVQLLSRGARVLQWTLFSEQRIESWRSVHHR